MSPPAPKSGSPAADAIQIRADGSGLVVLTPDDYDRFVETQPAVIDAVKAAREEQDHTRKLQERIGAFMAGLHYWCKSRPVELCVVTPRMDDIMVVIIASDEDAGGRLHEEMSAFDLANFRENNLRVSWILLRQSEREGLSAFANLASARLVYHAKPKAA
jgi:hypothetical protein